MSDSAVFIIGSLGDILARLDALHNIKKCQNSSIDLVTLRTTDNANIDMRNLLIESEIINNIIYIDYTQNTFATKIAALVSISKLKYKKIYYLSDDCGGWCYLRNYILIKLLTMTTVIGSPRNAFKGIRMISNNKSENIRDFTSRFLPYVYRSQYYIYPLLKLSQQRVANINSRFNLSDGKVNIAICLGGKFPVKDWGHRNWGRLLNMIWARYGDSIRLIGIGSNDESYYLNSVFNNHPSSINLAGQTLIEDTAALLKHCVLYIGHDSGPMHLSAAIGTPCIAIFSSRDYASLWFPYGDNNSIFYTNIDCMGCRKVTCDEYGNKCIQAISAEAVFDDIKRRLD